MVDPQEEVLYIPPSGSQSRDKFCLEKVSHEKKMAPKIYRTLDFNLYGIISSTTNLYEILVDNSKSKMFKNKIDVLNNWLIF
jgi:hypothetical protein